MQQTPNPTNRYPPIFSTRNGVTIPIAIVRRKFTKQPILTPLSVMTSGIYIHVIGPRENAKKATYRRIKTI